MKKLSILAIALGAVFFTSCKDDSKEMTEMSKENLTINLTGLEDLGKDFKYEGWLIVDGKPVSTGTFSDVSFPKTFKVDKNTLNAASKFVLTIEPTNDTDPAPSATKLLAGDFSNNKAMVSTKNLLGDFEQSSGKFILATPTDNNSNNEDSGVWFLDNTSGMAKAGLNLPMLPKGWKYEGWVVVDGKPISTGTFTAMDMADDNAATSPFKGTVGNGPAFPGEDYVMGAFKGTTFPVSLKGKKVVISVEPSPDNSPAPFSIKPLAKDIPANADVHKVIELGTGPVSEILGTVTR